MGGGRGASCCCREGGATSPAWRVCVGVVVVGVGVVGGLVREAWLFVAGVVRLVGRGTGQALRAAVAAAAACCGGGGGGRCRCCCCPAQGVQGQSPAAGAALTAHDVGEHDVMLRSSASCKGWRRQGKVGCWTAKTRNAPSCCVWVERDRGRGEWKERVWHGHGLDGHGACRKNDGLGDEKRWEAEALEPA